MKKGAARKVVFCLSLVLTILWMFTIYGFSANNAQESTVQSNAVTEIIIRIFNPEFEYMTHEEQHDIISQYDGIVRKVAHFVAYAILGFLTYICVTSAPFTSGARVLAYMLMSLPVCVIFAALDEYHQTMVDGRAGRISDVLIDSAGSVCGTLAAICLVVIIKMTISKSGKEG